MSISRRAFLRSFSILSAVGLLGACSGTPAASPTPEQRTAGTLGPTSGPASPSAPGSPTVAPQVRPSSSPSASTKEIVYATPRDLFPGVKDPYFCSNLLGVWEPLVDLGDDWTPKPALAERWEMQPDGLAWTFKLRPNITFIDGTPFTADVVVANVQRNLKISPRPSPFYPFVKETAYGDLKAVEKVDALTVRFTHHKPNGAFPAMIADYFSAMFAPASFDEQTGDFKGLPITTGPFTIKEVKKDQYAVLERNESYWGTKARAKTIRIRVIPDPNTRLSALRSGEIHGIFDLGAILPSNAIELQQDPRFGISKALSSITHYLFLNGTKPPFNDRRVRQALNLAIDREAIVRDTLFGFAQPAGSVLTSLAARWHDASIRFKYDPTEAAALARAALNGRREHVLFLLPSSALTRYPYKSIAEIIQASIQPLGLDAQIQVLETAAFNDATKQGAYHLALRTQGLPSGEPDALLRRYLSAEGDQNKGLSLGYRSDEAETMLRDLSIELNAEKRIALIKQLQQVAARDLPFLPLYYEEGIIAFTKALKDFVLTPAGPTLVQAYLEG